MRLMLRPTGQFALVNGTLTREWLIERDGAEVMRLYVAAVRSDVAMSSVCKDLGLIPMEEPQVHDLVEEVRYGIRE